MKKTAIFTLTAAAILFLGACNSKKEETAMGAKINVTVKNLLGTPQTGKTVYLYKDTEPTATTKPENAHSKVITDDKGMANFSLNLLELNILESQTSLYFVVFYQVGDGNLVAGSGAVTVKRNDTKALGITIPL